MRYITTLIFILICFWSIDSKAQIQMSGKVTNDNGEPLMGVLVTVEDTDFQTLTDSYGNYWLVVPATYSNHKVYANYHGFPLDSAVVKSGVHDFALNANRLETINTATYVSTQKRMQLNWEVPITLSVTGESKIDKLLIMEPQDLAYYTPGYHNQTQSCLYSVNVIRGVASDGSNSYSFFQPRISVFMDNVSITHMGTASTDLFDIQRAEVVKGPQGTLFGKGAEFGAVSYVTNKPVGNFEANIHTSYGSYNQKILQGMVNTPLSQKTKNRLSFLINDRDGYNTNLADGGDLSGKGAISLRNILKHDPNENVSVTFSIDYERNREPGLSNKGTLDGAPGKEFSPDPFSPAYFDATNLAAQRDMGGLSYTVEHRLSSKLTYSSITAIRAYKLHEHYDMDGTSNPIVAATDNQNGLQISEEVRLNLDLGSKLSAFGGISYMYDRNKHSVEMRTDLQHSFKGLVKSSLLNLTDSLPSQLAKGINGAIDFVLSGYKKMLPQYVDQLKPLIENVTKNVGPAIQSALRERFLSMMEREIWESTPDVYGESLEIVRDIIYSYLKSEMEGDPSTAFLAQYIHPDNVVSGLGLEKLMSVLVPYSNLPLESNYMENETDMNIYHEADIFADATYQITDKLSLTLGARGTFERQKTSYYSTSEQPPLVDAFVYHSTNGITHWLHDTEISWVGRAVASYMPRHNSNVYISVSKGRRPGSIYYNFDYRDPVKLQPETSVNYEIGYKGAYLKNHINYSFALYYYDWLHFQSQIPQIGQNGIINYVNTDQGKANAVGFEASVSANFEYINAFADYSFIDAKFTDKDSEGKVQAMAGHRFRMTPKHSYDMGLDVNIPIKHKLGVYLRPSYSWMSDMVFSVTDTDLSQDAYGLINMTIGATSTVGKVTYDIYLYGKNLADQKYLLDAGGTGQLMGSPTFIMGPPRMMGVGLRLGIR